MGVDARAARRGLTGRIHRATANRSARCDEREADLVLGPGQDGKTIQPASLKASAMNERRTEAVQDVAQARSIF